MAPAVPEKEAKCLYAFKKSAATVPHTSYTPIRSKFGVMQPLVYFSSAAISSENAHVSWALRSEAFRLAWSNFIDMVEELLYDALRPGIQKIVSFIEQASKSTMPEVPTCLALAGIDAADHAHVLSSLTAACRDNVGPFMTRHIAIVKGEAFDSALQAVTHVVEQFEGKNREHLGDNEKDVDTLSDAGNSWNCITNRLLLHYNRTLKKRQELVLAEIGNKDEPVSLQLVMIFENAEYFSSKVLCGFIRYGYYLREEHHLPVIFVMGISFSSRFVELLCDPNIFKKLCVAEIEVFNAKAVGDKLFSVVLRDPFSVPFLILEKSLNLLQFRFNHYNLCFSMILKSLYQIFLDFYSNQPVSFLARPLEELCEPLCPRSTRVDEQQNSATKISVADMKIRFKLLLAITTGGLEDENGLLENDGMDKILVCIGKKYAINLAVLFDSHLSQFQKQIGETAKSRQIVTLGQGDILKYIDSCCSLIIAKCTGNRNRLPLVTLLKRIEASFQPLCPYLREITRNCSLKDTNKNDYEKLLSQLKELIRLYEKPGKVQGKLDVLEWIREFLKSLFSGPHVETGFFLLWERSEAWMEKQFLQSPNSDCISSMVNDLSGDKTCPAHNKPNISKGGNDILSVNGNKMTGTASDLRSNILFTDLQTLYRLYECSGLTTSLWDWFCAFCRQIIQRNGNTSKDDGTLEQEAALSFATCHVRFILAVSTFVNIFGLMQIHSNHSANQLFQSNDLLQEGDVKMDTIHVTEDNQMNDHKTKDVCALQRRMSQFRAKKSHWGKVLTEKENESDAELTVQKPLKRRRGGSSSRGR